MALSSPIPVLGENPLPSPATSGRIAASAGLQADTWVAGLNSYDTATGTANQRAQQAAGTLAVADFNQTTLENLAAKKQVVPNDVALTDLILQHQAAGSFDGYWPKHPGTLTPTNPAESARPYWDYWAPTFGNVLYNLMASIIRLLTF